MGFNFHRAAPPRYPPSPPSHHHYTHTHLGVAFIEEAVESTVRVETGMSVMRLDGSTGTLELLTVTDGVMNPASALLDDNNDSIATNHNICADGRSRISRSICVLSAFFAVHIDFLLSSSWSAFLCGFPSRGLPISLEFLQNGRVNERTEV